jgi:hypothetical protein
MDLGMEEAAGLQRPKSFPAKAFCRGDGNMFDDKGTEDNFGLIVLQGKGPPAFQVIEDIDALLIVQAFFQIDIGPDWKSSSL